jgi:hypothetical protein
MTDAKLQWVFLFELDDICNYTKVKLFPFIASILLTEKKSFKMNEA